jgi:multisubunit Na+/H+ antiporter MnhG subunit
MFTPLMHSSSVILSLLKSSVLISLKKVFLLIRFMLYLGVPLGNKKTSKALMVKMETLVLFVFLLAPLQSMNMLNNFYRIGLRQTPPSPSTPPVLTLPRT